MHKVLNRLPSTSHHRDAAARSWWALACTVGLAAASCKPTSFSGNTGNTSAASATNRAADPGSNTSTQSGTGPNNTSDSSTTGANGGGSGGSGGVSSIGGNTGNTSNPACSAGCCPSQTIAFVDCSGGTAAGLNKGQFNITPVACAAVQSSTNALSGYDTVFYYGPVDYNGTGKLPPAVDAALNGGAKVIAYMSTGSLSPDNPFYSLTLEHNMEFVSGVSGSTISVVHTDAMASAFSQSTYGAATFTYLMFLGPFLLVNSSLFDSATEALWCSDLSARSALGVQSTSFHGYLLDSPSRRGLLIASTLSLPNDQTGFDFTEPFMAAQLSQPWNPTGGSSQCGLSCGGGITTTSAGSASPTTGTTGSTPANASPSPGLLGGLGGLGGLSGVLSSAGGGLLPGGGGTAANFPTATGVGKPVIYLYPTVEQDISVKLDFAGKLVTTYPRYDSAFGGWQVHASPDGRLVDKADGQEYGYIYWNGTTDAFVPTFTTGFVVKGTDSRTFLQEKLAYLGLNAREANDMIVYWLPYLEQNPYNLIHFAGDEYTSIAKMTIDPRPDSLLRVFMAYTPLTAPTPVREQKLTPFKRVGFSVVEWGGTEIGGSWHIVQ